MVKSELTIKQFIALAKKELADYMSTVKHSDDAISFSEWTSENGKVYQKEYGVYYSHEFDMWMYSSNNNNFPGDFVCDACGCQCDAEESGLCKDCDYLEE